LEARVFEVVTESRHSWIPWVITINGKYEFICTSNAYINSTFCSVVYREDDLPEEFDTILYYSKRSTDCN
jgi:hypothetical protein